jgi:DNA-binding XRE family transcriptional regulator
LFDSVTPDQEAEMIITGDQVSVARELLSWTQTDLAKRANLKKRTVVHFESGARPLPFFDLALVKGILESAGIEFDEGAARLTEQ